MAFLVHLDTRKVNVGFLIVFLFVRHFQSQFLFYREKETALLFAFPTGPKKFFSEQLTEER